MWCAVRQITNRFITWFSSDRQKYFRSVFIYILPCPQKETMKISVRTALVKCWHSLKRVMITIHFLNDGPLICFSFQVWNKFNQWFLQFHLWKRYMNKEGKLKRISHICVTVFLIFTRVCFPQILPSVFRCDYSISETFWWSNAEVFHGDNDNLVSGHMS